MAVSKINIRVITPRAPSEAVMKAVYPASLYAPPGLMNTLTGTSGVQRFVQRLYRRISSSVARVRIDI